MLTRAGGALALAAAAAALAGCSDGARHAAPSRTLRVYALGGDRSALERVFAAFELRNPGVKIRAAYADLAPYQSTLRTQLASGTAPDVFEVWPGNGNPGAIQVLAPYHYLADLSSRPFARREPAGLRAVTHVGGRLYTVPLAISGLGPIYNLSVLRSLGVRPPATWSGVLALCAKARAKGIAAYALGMQDAWVGQLIPYALVPTTVYARTPRFDALLRAGKASFARSGWLAAENRLLAMRDAGCFQRFPLATNFEASETMLATGKAAGLVQGSWALAAVEQQAPKGTRFVLAPLPANDRPATTRMAGAPAGAFAVNARTSNPNALKLIDFFATPAAQETFARANGSLPAYTSGSYRPPASLATFVRYLRAGRTDPFMDQLWPNAKVQEAHLAGLQSVFAGSETVTQVLQAMDRAYRAG